MKKYGNSNNYINGITITTVPELVMVMGDIH